MRPVCARLLAALLMVPLPLLGLPAGTAAAQQIAAIDPVAAELPVEQPGPHVVARIDISEQKMWVYVDQRLAYVWPVSTGRRGHATPTGQFHPGWMARNWHSRTYDWAPMPWSVFFNSGIAVHGTTAISRLGRPDSHGCVRLHPDNAKIFYRLVEQHGMADTLIAVVR
jgi:lipoprotein-anchoring transpeptidase ErfK/SrfK